MTLIRTRLLALLALVGAFAAATVVSACGDDPKISSKPSGTPKEQAFLQGMVPHHMMAIEMAQMAQQMATKPEIKQLASSIITSQGGEIEKMNAIYGRLFAGAALKPDKMAHDKMGLTMEEAGMGMTDKEMQAMMGAKPFDREFIDMMIPHHQGAIRMARVVLASTKDPEVRSLAQAIVTAQSKEIMDMNGWRARWYGKPSPAGDVPTA